MPKSKISRKERRRRQREWVYEIAKAHPLGRFNGRWGFIRTKEYTFTSKLPFFETQFQALAYAALHKLKVKL